MSLQTEIKNPILADALTFAAAGFAAGPYKVDGAGNKKPLGRGKGFSDWSSDPKSVRSLFNAISDYDGFGVKPGTGGFIVIDLDVKKGAEGPTWFRRLVDAYGDDFEDLFDTFTHRTPSGGLHLWFKAGSVSCGNKNGTVIMPDGSIHTETGIDIRQNDGFVPLPPILGPHNGYEPIGDLSLLEAIAAGDLKAAPEWFAQAWPARSASSSKVGDREEKVNEFLGRFNAGPKADEGFKDFYKSDIESLRKLKSGRHGLVGGLMGRLVGDLRRRAVDAEWVISETKKALETSRAGEGRDSGLEVEGWFEHCVIEELKKSSWSSSPLPVNEALADAESPAAFQLALRGFEHWSADDTPPRPRPSPAMFHGPLGAFALEAGDYTEADPVAIYAQALTMFGVAANKNAHMLAGNDRHPAALFTVIVGATAKGAKGTSGAVAGGLMFRVEPALKDRQFYGFGSGEQLIADLAGEGIEGSRDTRVLMFETELAGLLTVAARQNSIVSQTVRNAWDGKALQNRTRSGPIVADDYHLGAIGHITADEFRSKLAGSTEIANGFVNRWLMVWAQRGKLQPNGGNVPDSVFNRYTVILRANLVKAWKLTSMHRTPEAGRRWDEIYHEAAGDDPAGVLGGAISRSNTQMLRLSLATAIADGADAIGVAHVEAAGAFWDYCRDTAAHILGESTGNHDADRLLSELRRVGSAGMDFTAQRDLFSKHAGRSDSARAVLERRGLAATVVVPTEGRPSNVSFAIRAKDLSSLSSQSDIRGEEVIEENPSELPATKATKGVVRETVCVGDFATKATEAPIHTAVSVSVPLDEADEYDFEPI
jgi:hypothetical protein